MAPVGPRKPDDSSLWLTNCFCGRKRRRSSRASMDYLGNMGQKQLKLDRRCVRHGRHHCVAAVGSQRSKFKLYSCHYGQTVFKIVAACIITVLTDDAVGFEVLPIAILHDRQTNA